MIENPHPQWVVLFFLKENDIFAGNIYIKQNDVATFYTMRWEDWCSSTLSCTYSHDWFELLINSTIQDIAGKVVSSDLSGIRVDKRLSGASCFVITIDTLVVCFSASVSKCECKIESF